VICGFDPARPDMAGFDTDICRALAAALFDNPDAIDVRPMDPAVASSALAAGEIDMYAGRLDLPDSHAGPTLFVDAVGAVARTDVGIKHLTDLKFTTICLIQDSVEERLFNEAAAAARVKVQPILFNADDVDAMYTVYDEGHCDAVVDNRVRLAQRLATLSAPREQGLIDLTLPIESRGPLTPPDDASWTQVVDAISLGLIRAEELGVTTTELETALSGDNAEIHRLLGIEGKLGADLGLPNDFVARVVRHLGNYGQIYDRYFAGLPRGPNALFKDGGRIGQP
jgi:general L-amino acid transport system substrate-binding protein